MNELASQKQLKKSSFSKYLLLRIPIPLSIIYTFYLLNIIFIKKSEVILLFKIDPYENSTESKLSLISKIVFALGFIIGVLIQIAMILRFMFGTKLSSNRSDPLPILFVNKLLDNSLQNYLFFLGNILYFIFCDPQNIEPAQIYQKNVVTACVSFFYIFSRIVFCLSYAIGVAINIPALRAFGHIPCHILSIMLTLQNLGYDMFSNLI